MESGQSVDAAVVQFRPRFEGFVDRPRQFRGSLSADAIGEHGRGFGGFLRQHGGRHARTVRPRRLGDVIVLHSPHALARQCADGFDFGCRSGLPTQRLEFALKGRGGLKSLGGTCRSEGRRGLRGCNDGRLIARPGRRDIDQKEILALFEQAKSLLFDFAVDDADRFTAGVFPSVETGEISARDFVCDELGAGLLGQVLHHLLPGGGDVIQFNERLAGLFGRRIWNRFSRQQTSGWNQCQLAGAEHADHPATAVVDRLQPETLQRVTTR